MEQYYNHLTDRLEDLEPFMAKTLPRSKAEYEARLAERMGAAQSLRKFSENVRVTLDKPPFENPMIRAAKEYLEAHPEEVIKLRDEGLVEEMIDFAAKQNAEYSNLAFPDAPTEEEAYLEKREREGKPLVIWEEVGNWDKDAIDKLEGNVNSAVDNAKEMVHNIEPSRYMMGNDPYGDALTKPYIAKKNEDGSVQYLKNPEDILEDGDEEFESSIQEVSKYILLIITGVVLCLILYLGLK